MFVVLGDACGIIFCLLVGCFCYLVVLFICCVLVYVCFVCWVGIVCLLYLCWFVWFLILVFNGVGALVICFRLLICETFCLFDGCVVLFAWIVVGWGVCCCLVSVIVLEFRFVIRYLTGFLFTLRVRLLVVSVLICLGFVERCLLDLCVSWMLCLCYVGCSFVFCFGMFCLFILWLVLNDFVRGDLLQVVCSGFMIYVVYFCLFACYEFVFAWISVCFNSVARLRFSVSFTWLILFLLVVRIYLCFCLLFIVDVVRLMVVGYLVLLCW